MGNITGHHGNWISEVAEEEIAMVHRIMDHLLIQAKEDISTFTVLEIKSYRVLKEYEIRWNPHSKVEAFSHVRHFKIEYIPVTGKLEISSSVYSQNNNVSGLKSADESYHATYNIGFNNSESILSLRKKFALLYRMSNEYWSDYVPRKRQEDATNHFCRLFPEIVDEILLSEILDDKEGNN